MNLFNRHLNVKKNSRCKLFVRNNPSSEPVGLYKPPEEIPPSFAAAPNVGIEDDSAVHDTSMDGMDVSMEEVEAPLPLSDRDEDDDAASDPVNAALTDDVDEPQCVNLPEGESHKDLLHNFLQYSERAEENYVDLTPEYRSAIELMRILDVVGAPLSAYDKIMDWHTKLAHCATCDMPVSSKVSHSHLMKFLRERYNMEDLQPYNVRTYLPSLDVDMDLPCHDFGGMMRDLITDPRITDEDYLFFNDDPREPPPSRP